jgi:hypothetical protein
MRRRSALAFGDAFDLQPEVEEVCELSEDRQRPVGRRNAVEMELAVLARHGAA